MVTDEGHDPADEIEMDTGAGEAVPKTEMPLRLLVVGDFVPEAPDVEDWVSSSRLFEITPGSFQAVMGHLNPSVSLDVPNRLGDAPKELPIDLAFPDMKALRPEGIAQQVDVLAEVLKIRALVGQLRDRELTREAFAERLGEMDVGSVWRERLHQLLSEPQAAGTPTPPDPPGPAPKQEEGGLDSLLDMVDVDEEGGPPSPPAGAPVDDLIRAVLRPERRGPGVDRSTAQAIIDELDRSVGRQIDDILHHPKFQHVESAWRGLKFLIDRTDFQGNIRIELLSAHKGELRDAMYHQVFTPEYNEVTEIPLSVVIADYAFDRTAEDMELLGDIVQIAAGIQVPVIASVGSAFFGVQTAQELAKLPALRSLFQQPEYAQWNALRDQEESQYLAFAMSRVLLRPPYGPDGIRLKEFDFAERRESEADHLWVRGAFAVAVVLVRSFAEHGWGIRITGPSGGTVDNLPVRPYRMAGRDVHIPLDVLLTRSREQEFIDAGFILLSSRINDSKAMVLAAPTMHRPKSYTTPEATKEARLHATLPYVMFATRVAHYLRRIVPEVSTGLAPEQVQNMLIGKFRSVLASGGSVSPDAVMARVLDSEEKPDCYNVALRIQPPFQILGQQVDLVLGIELRR